MLAVATAPAVAAAAAAVAANVGGPASCGSWALREALLASSWLECVSFLYFERGLKKFK